VNTENNDRVLEKYIATLSDEERRRHRELINECRSRDEQISRDTANALSSLKRFTEISQDLMEALYRLDASTRHLLKKTAESYLRLLDSSSMGHS